MNDIAIVGMGCRLPGGANSYSLLWDLLLNKFDAFSKIPENRWDLRRFYSSNPKKPGKTYAHEAAFLDKPIDEFDPLFFGISPREAECLDPQQRFLLEITWEAFEDAGLQIESLRGSKTGVFVGGFCLDNKLLQLSGHNRRLIDSYTPTSSTMAIMSNRLSYVFDLKGPSITIDTACSSSLVAIHYACESILRGDSEMAIAAGVNIMLKPEYFIAMSKGGFLSKHCRCMAFDERAGGYARGEGVGALILKPLEKAIADRDAIHAIISATGVNQDGHTTGMASPNKDSQEALIRTVYDKAKIAVDDIGYVEAHGTGTQMGDVAEMSSLGAIFSERKKQQKVFVGSIKTNIGHLEAGAGVAGVIKAVLSLKHGKIAPNLHFEQPNPKIEFDKIPITVPTKVTPWPEVSDNPRYASVNSFGYGGTNAHAVLKNFSQSTLTSPQKKSENLEKVIPVCFSTNDKEALKELIKRYSIFIANDSVKMIDLTYSLNCRRSHLSERICFLVNDKACLIKKIQSYLKEGFVDGVTKGTAVSGKQVFVYTGMGPQWAGMGKYLYETHSVFRDSLLSCDKTFQSVSGWSILNEVLKDESQSRMLETRIAQPANFVIQVALTEMLAHWGIKPDAVVGHSVGEVAAAYVSGALSLEDACMVSLHRSNLQQTLSGCGGMVAAALSVEQAKKLIRDYETVSIAAINGPETVTLAGDIPTLKIISHKLDEEKIFNRLLDVDIPYHSHSMTAIRDRLLAVLKNIKPRKTTIPLYSTVTGSLLDGVSVDAEYWWKNVRQPVLFFNAMTEIMNGGYQHAIEVGPHPVLKNAIFESATHLSKNICHYQTLNRKQKNEYDCMLKAFSELYCQGAAVNFQPFIGESAEFVRLLSYPWQKQRYWRETAESFLDRNSDEKSVWFNKDLRQPYPAWEVEFSREYFPYIIDHKVQGSVVFPAASYIDAGLQLHKKLSGFNSCIIENISFHGMLVLNDDEEQILHLEYDRQTSSYKVFSSTLSDNLSWRLHTYGRIVSESLIERKKNVDVAELRREVYHPIDVKKQYAELEKRGLDYGPYFQSIKECFYSEDKVLLQLIPTIDVAPNECEFIFHPSILDGSFHAMLHFVKFRSGTYVPVSIKKFKIYSEVNHPCWALISLVKENHNLLQCNIIFFTEDGDVLAEIEEVACKCIENKLANVSAVQERLHYELEWQPSDINFQKGAVNTRSQHWMILFAEPPTESLFFQRFSEKVGHVTLAVQGKQFEQVRPDYFLLPFDSKTAFDQLLAQVKPNQILYINKPVSCAENKVTSEHVIQCVWPLTVLAQSLSQSQQNLGLTVLSYQTQIVKSYDDFIDLSASPIEALLRLIANELTNVETYFIDSDAETHINHLIGDMIYKSKATVVAWRKNKRHVKKLLPYNLDTNKNEPLSIQGHNVELRVDCPGDLDSLQYYEIPMPAPKRNEVLIEVRASALNFKDLLKVYGRIADDVIADTFFGDTLGMEMAGLIVAIGEDVNDFKIGDQVIASIPNAFCAYASAHTNYVVHKPSCLNYSQAPILIPYMASYRGLIDIAQLREGEKVLIHNATGGVGFAAIDIAKWRGAEIYATAGSETKRAFLKKAGIKYVYDSRSLSFVEGILEDTSGYGVDVVLNAIAGEALIQSFNLLAPYGRFIEIGKRDIAEGTGLPMQAFNRNLLFASVDIDRMLLERIEVVKKLSAEITTRFNAGDFHHMPVRSFSATTVADAFSTMSKSQHMGKIVLTFDKASTIPAIPMQESKTIARANGSYIVTGGTGGFGFEVGRWLAEQGAGHVVLISRSGAKLAEQQDRFSSLQKHFNVSVLSVDVSDEAALSLLVADLNASKYPLKGVIHSAMVLDDALLTDLSIERYHRVLSPKIDGVMNLHRVTKLIALDFFVLFSSISSLIGNSGQANYIVANSFLDNIALLRRSKNLPASVINWGVLSEAGVVARNKVVAETLDKIGIKGFSNRQALSILNWVIGNKETPTEIGAFDLDWNNWANLNPNLADSIMFSEVIQPNNIDPNNEKRQALLNELLPLLPEERKQIIVSRTTELVSTLLKMPANKINIQSNLDSFGIDSLSAAELTSNMQKRFFVKVSTSNLLSGVSIDKLSLMILEILITKEDEILWGIEGLSEHELDSLLEENKLTT
jgi:acyl transferase domain-containing protein/NADPH:quinone reductase-like Zn-dependent oxidoreductase/acyl carrier protein